MRELAQLRLQRDDNKQASGGWGGEGGVPMVRIVRAVPFLFVLN